MYNNPLITIPRLQHRGDFTHSHPHAEGEVRGGFQGTPTDKKYHGNRYDDKNKIRLISHVRYINPL